MTSADEIFYGGGETISIMNEDGLSNLFVSPNLMLTNSFEVTSVKPGELASNQEVAAFLATFKGVSARDKGMMSVTLVMESEAIVALIKMLRMKLAEVPVHLR